MAKPPNPHQKPPRVEARSGDAPSDEVPAGEAPGERPPARDAARVPHRQPPTTGRDSPERISGHRVPPSRTTRTADLPEHDWSAARERVYPLLQPPGTSGIPLERLRKADLTAASGRAHAEPLVARGPCGLMIVFGMQAAGFDVLVSLEHLGAWGIGADALEKAASANLEAWSERTGWTEESSGERRLLSSDSGEGYDSSRILLEPVRRHLSRELAGERAAAGTRVLIGLPDRHLLVAGALGPGDPEFVALFREFVGQQSDAADEPIDRRIFEISGGGELVEFAA
jgi:hypothetical protein